MMKTSSPAAAKSVRNAFSSSAGTAARRPPEVWGSKQSSRTADAASRFDAGGDTACAFAAWNELRQPAANNSNAPGNAGIASPDSCAPTPLARNISDKCPAKPKPVTSVQARTP